MHSLKVALYAATVAFALLFAFWEMRFRRKAGEELLPDSQRPSDHTVMGQIFTDIKREQLLHAMRPQARSRLRLLIGLKLFFCGLLIAEVILLQR